MAIATILISSLTISLAFSCSTSAAMWKLNSVYLKFFEGDTRDNADDGIGLASTGRLQISEATRAAATFYYWQDQEHKGTLGFTPYQYWIAG
jgi:hypothetical protein